uniref:Uncharacterized protein n=1 Tax=uncultured marine group II/III euryarchaeote KM3_44_G05 TaxID=1456448 RepID=A0A075H4T9_9EURY|nr:hypothetical protein [uncultured marine group II/III euryarchaeote KM3_44_G05]
MLALNMQIPSLHHSLPSVERQESQNCNPDTEPNRGFHGGSEWEVWRIGVRVNHPELDHYPSDEEVESLTPHKWEIGHQTIDENYPESVADHQHRKRLPCHRIHAGKSNLPDVSATRKFAAVEVPSAEQKGQRTNEQCDDIAPPPSFAHFTVVEE